jgi:putative MFS transporter
VLEHLERQTSLTNNQRKIVFAAILGDMLDFFDFYLIGFVLAFIVGSWKLTYGQSAMILLSCGRRRCSLRRCRSGPRRRRS